MSSLSSTHLKHREQALDKTIEIVSWLWLRLVEIEFTAEHLHAQQRKNDNEQEQQQQQRSDWLNRVEQWCDEIRERSPISRGVCGWEKGGKCEVWDESIWENRVNWIQTSTVMPDNPLKWKSQSEHRHETYLVTLNTRRSRTQRRTEIPSGGIMWVWQSTISIILPNTTKQSKRLNNDTKYPWNPKLYIFRNISMVNSATKNMFVYSVEKKKASERKRTEKRVSR